MKYFFCHYLSLKLWAQRYSYQLISSSLSDLNSEASHDRYIESRLNWIAKQLRNHPYWLDGHIVFAELSITQGNLIAAYGAVQCALKLSDTPISKRKIQGLLAKVYLGMGQPEQALEILTHVAELPDVSFSEREDLAAALMALGRDSEAESILEELASSDTGGRTAGVLKYLAQKQE